MVEDPNKKLDQSKPGFQAGGGPAIKPKSSKGGTIKRVASAATGGVEGVKDAGKGIIAEGAGDAVASGLVASGLGAFAGAGRWITKKATQWGLDDWRWLKIAAAPIISMLLLTVVSGVAIAGIVKANKGAYGNEAPNPISMTNPEDRSELNELMRLSGDFTQDDAAKLSELLNKIADKVHAGDLTFPDKDKAVAAMDRIQLIADGIVADSASASAKAKLKTAIEEFLDLYSDNPAPLTGSFYSPAGRLDNITFNNSSHGRSTTHPKSRYNSDGSRQRHDVFIAFNSPGTGDAVDIHIDGLGSKAYAMYDGKVTKVNSSCMELLSNTDPVIKSWYCHVSGANNDNVRAGDVIGETDEYDGHIHLEIFIGNTSIHTTEADYKSNKYSQFGKYMWDNMLTIFDGFKATTQ